MDHDKVLVTDPKGRRALQSYFQKHKDDAPENDAKLLNIYNKHVYYCELHSERAKEEESVLQDVKEDLLALGAYLEDAIKELPAISGQMEDTQVYRVMELIANYLGKKYHEKLRSGKFLQQAILQSAVNQHKEHNKLHLMSIMGSMEMKI